MEKLSDRTIEERLEKLEGWDFKNGAIESSYKFKDFRDAFAAMTRVAFECEKQGHHPDWTNIYNTLTIRLSTHDAKGVTEKDFTLAHSIDTILR